MHNIYDEYICNVLKLFSKAKITETDIDAIRPNNGLPLCKLKKLKPHSEFITMGFDINSVFIVLTGNCHCIVYSVLGDSIVADNMIAPQILGVLELLSNTPQYTSTIKTTKESYVLEVPKDIFEHAMLNNLSVSHTCTCFFANIAQYYMDMANFRGLYSNEDTILLYIFNNCDKSALPYRITISRRTMSDLLGINLRTLYRHLGKLEALGYFTIINGKITLNEEQYDIMDQYCTAILGEKRKSVSLQLEYFQ